MLLSARLGCIRPTDIVDQPGDPFLFAKTIAPRFLQQSAICSEPHLSAFNMIVIADILSRRLLKMWNRPFHAFRVVNGRDDISLCLALVKSIYIVLSWRIWQLWPGLDYNVFDIILNVIEELFGVFKM